MPVTGKYYTAENEARRIPEWDGLIIAAVWERYESAKVKLTEIATWDMNRADPI